MLYETLFIGMILLFCSCISPNQKEIIYEPTNNQIICSNISCFGTYIGPEFINNSDVAHQFSNKMSSVVGDKLKELYDKEIYSKVYMDTIIMTTVGMGSGQVHYYLKIPFIRVSNKCDAFTSFDHVDGWNHKPELEKRINQLTNLLLPNQQLNISPLLITNEGLQEYWIQWKNKEKQHECH